MHSTWGCAAQTPWVYSISHVKLTPGWALIWVNFDPIQEIGPKVALFHKTVVIRGTFENLYEFTSVRIFAIVIHYCSAYLWQFIHLTDFYTGSWYRWSHSHSSDSVTLWSGHGANQEEVLSEIPPISRVFYKGRTEGGRLTYCTSFISHSPP